MGSADVKLMHSELDQSYSEQTGDCTRGRKARLDKGCLLWLPISKGYNRRRQIMRNICIIMVFPRDAGRRPGWTTKLVEKTRRYGLAANRLAAHLVDTR